MILAFITVRLLDILDIFLVAVLLYQSYRLIRGTVAMDIFIGIVSFYFLWRVVSSLHMELLSNILGQFIGVGVLVLVIVFQQEIRRFLLILGTRYAVFRKQYVGFNKLLNNNVSLVTKSNIDAIVHAAFTMSKSQTGALIVFSPHVDLTTYVQTGESLDAAISSTLLQTIFFKNSPLHDGAVLIFGNRIKGAKAVLPSTERSDLPVDYGMRHRSAIGMSEETKAIVIVVSEQTGNVSYCLNGQIYTIETPEALQKALETQTRKGGR
ncbi:MAG: TIGR00159 family protein [Bacteroidales bacterium]|nr:TIGR00159 family protein [Bacteroidales bacterium]